MIGLLLAAAIAGTPPAAPCQVNCFIDRSGKRICLNLGGGLGGGGTGTGGSGGSNIFLPEPGLAPEAPAARERAERSVRDMERARDAQAAEMRAEREARTSAERERDVERMVDKAKRD